MGDILFYFSIGTPRSLILAPPFTEKQVNKLQDGRPPPQVLLLGRYFFSSRIVYIFMKKGECILFGRQNIQRCCC